MTQLLINAFFFVLAAGCIVDCITSTTKLRRYFNAALAVASIMMIKGTL